MKLSLAAAWENDVGGTRCSRGFMLIVANGTSPLFLLSMPLKEHLIKLLLEGLVIIRRNMGTSN